MLRINQPVYGYRVSLETSVPASSGTLQTRQRYEVQPLNAVPSGAFRQRCVTSPLPPRSPLPFSPSASPLAHTRFPFTVQDTHSLLSHQHSSLCCLPSAATLKNQDHLFRPRISSPNNSRRPASANILTSQITSHRRCSPAPSEKRPWLGISATLTASKSWHDHVCRHAPRRQGGEQPCQVHRQVRVRNHFRVP